MESIFRPSTDTWLVHAGRTPARYEGFVNVPLFRGSTRLVDSFDAWEAACGGTNAYAHYGRFGSPTTRALEEAVCDMERGHRSIVFPSGLSACTHALMAVLRGGDHLLMADNVYGPARTFAQNVLVRMGVKVTFFDPRPESDTSFEQLLQAGTRAVYLESPGSLSFELCDVAALTSKAKRAGLRVLIDNTWATPLFFRPLEHGVDISIQSATKYIVGHSDALLGVATANEESWSLLEAGAHDFGETAGPDDVNLALRGLRTLGPRIRQHERSALALARIAQAHPAVAAVLHPALPSHPQHALWQRDFSGSTGLFGIVLARSDRSSIARFFSTTRLFGIGLSWGGYESLVLPVGRPQRSDMPWPHSGFLLRLHAGLESPEDLAADLTAALDSVI